MRRFTWHVVAAIVLVSVSAIVYGLQIRLFHKPEDTFFYLIQDTAFIPIQVLLVSLVLNEVLKDRQKVQMQHKMNMVIGAFFSEAGNDLLKKLIAFDPHVDEIAPAMVFDSDFPRSLQTKALRVIENRTHFPDAQYGDLNDLKEFMVANRVFLIGLLENENLLEHESFTDLMWAITHLSEELSCRSSFEGLPSADYSHLSTDIDRVYKRLISAWLAYARHLKNEYPYMFSLLLRSNPFDKDASVYVE